MKSKSNNEIKTQGRVIFTSDEVLRLGIPCHTPPPVPERCPFCGRELFFEGIVFGGAVFVWRSVPVRCICAEAVRFWAERDEALRLECEAEGRRRKAERRDKLIRESGMKRRFLSRNFDNFQTDGNNAYAYGISLEYAENFDVYFEDGQGLYFEGSCGSGKTHLASAIALYLIERGRRVICMTSPDILSKVKQNFSRDSFGEDGAEVFRRTELLIIDDLGKEQCTEWSVAMLYSIINSRYEALLPTVITTNYSPGELTMRLKPKSGDSSAAVAIVSRLSEVCRRVIMTGRDFRSS